MRLTALLFSLGLILFSVGSAVGQEILVDHVEGLDDPVAGTFSTGATLTFHMRIVGDATPHLMLNNGFTFTPDGLTIGSLTGEYNTVGYPDLEDWFDFLTVMNYWADGTGEDTVGTGLLSMTGSGLPVDFDGVLYTFTIGPVDGPAGATVTLDSSWYPPSNPWMWDIVGENVGWGGPYTYTIGDNPCAGGPTTYCTPQCTILKAIDRILAIHIECESVDDVDLASIRVQGNIPPYQPAIISGNEVITYAFIMRFLGASGFRPVTGDFTATYTVEYDLDGGGHPVLTGDYCLNVYPGDVTLDGQANMDDIIFAADYFWRNGGVPAMMDNEGNAWQIEELLDANQDGSIDPRDVLEIRNIVL